MRKTLMGATTLAGLMTCCGAAGADDASSVIAGLPAALQAQYQGAPQSVTTSVFESFKAVPTPWKWCHSESYQGNPWRVSVTNELRRLVEDLKAQGVVSSFEVSDSNNDTGQQINQIRAFIDKKCSVITAIPGSATALNDAVDAAYAAGIPFVTAAGSVTTAKALNVDSNYARWGYDMMKAVAAKLDGKGNVLVVEGIAGHPIVAQEKQGEEQALKEEPGLKVVRTVNGNWTPNVTKTVVLQALATYPGKIDAVWTTGSESRVIAEAFGQAGRPAPLITGSITGDALGYWKANGDKYRFEGNGVLPGWTSQTLFRAAVMTLGGDGPKLNTLLIPIPVVHGADLGQWYKPCMTPDSVSVFPVPPTDPIPASLMDAYFKTPKPVPGWDYAKVPQACAGQ